MFIEEALINKGLTSGSKQAQLEGNAQLVNEHKEYKRKQVEVSNKRIEKLLTSRKNNPALQKYLEDKTASYDTASLGETSADELAVKSGGEDSGIDILRGNPLIQSYDSDK